METLRRDTPAFIPPSLWPPNSPDLNPVDYKIWGVLQDRVYRTRIRDVEHLKERLVEEWAHFSQNVIDSAVNQWRRRLRACVRADGGHFEQTMCARTNCGLSNDRPGSFQSQHLNENKTIILSACMACFNNVIIFTKLLP